MNTIKINPVISSIFHDIGSTQYYLIPHTAQKSFYNKAIVIICCNGWKYLQSYNTIVCAIDNAGNLHRFWSGYSATTAKHINAFLFDNKLKPLGKKQWLSIETEKNCKCTPCKR